MRPDRLGRRRGTTLFEVMFTMTIIGVLISMSVPSFHRLLEQSRADMAGANLQALWSAERVYWLEHRTYTADLGDLQSLGLIDPILLSNQATYAFQVSSADENTFHATATRVQNGRWNGTFSVDQTGQITGALSAIGEFDIVPGYK
jgi:prepilin-type N-terminal cleavage/methylation domain-containing protein